MPGAVLPVEVTLLGPVAVRAPGAIEPDRCAQATEIVAFLAAHPGGVHPAVLTGAVWPRGVTSRGAGRGAGPRHGLARLRPGRAAPDHRRRRPARAGPAGPGRLAGVPRAGARAGPGQPSAAPDGQQPVPGGTPGCPVRRTGWPGPWTRCRASCSTAATPAGTAGWPPTRWSTRPARWSRTPRTGCPGSGWRPVTATARWPPPGAGLRLASSDELLWRDLLAAAHASGDESVLRDVVAEVSARAALDEVLPGWRRKPRR